MAPVNTPGRPSLSAPANMNCCTNSSSCGAGTAGIVVAAAAVVVVVVVQWSGGGSGGSLPSCPARLASAKAVALETHTSHKVSERADVPELSLLETAACCGDGGALGWTSPLRTVLLKIAMRSVMAALTWMDFGDFSPGGVFVSLWEVRGSETGLWDVVVAAERGLASAEPASV